MFLESLTQHAVIGACPLRICLSSRHYPHISVEKSVSMILEDQPEHNRDIELYVQRKLAGGTGPKMEDLRNKVRDRSVGVFLWVVLVVPTLNKAHDQGRSISTMLRKLNETPSNLYQFSDQIFLKDIQDLDECVDLLQWVLYTKRPLQPLELYHAVQHVDVQTGGEESGAATLDEAIRYLRSCSRGLVELTKTRTPTIQFVHDIVRDYLAGPAVIDLLTPIGIIAEGFQADTCHTKLAEACLRYLLQCCYEMSRFEETSSYARVDRVLCQNPFALYAAEHWWQHLQSVSSTCSARVVQLAVELLTNNLLSWIKLYNRGSRIIPSTPWLNLKATAGPL